MAERGVGVLYVQPGGFSSHCAEILLTELNCTYHRREINLHTWQQFSPEFLAINPLGTVPVLVSTLGGGEGEPEEEEEEVHCGIKNIRKYLKTRPQFAQADVFKGGERYLSKLENLPIGPLTYGLAFHQEYTRVTRYPYASEEFFETARDYILNRSSRLSQAALDVNDPGSSEALLKLAEDHQASLHSYLEEAGFQQLYSQFQAALKFFEGEFEADRVELWMEGVAFSSTDIVLGLLLHRLWQLGLESEMFGDGEKPNLAVYYSRMKKRESFKRVTRWETNPGEKRFAHPDERLAQNAKMGLGAMLLLGGLYVGKKLFKK